MSLTNDLLQTVVDRLGTIFQALEWQRQHWDDGPEVDTLRRDALSFAVSGGGAAETVIARAEAYLNFLSPDEKGEGSVGEEPVESKSEEERRWKARVGGKNNHFVTCPFCGHWAGCAVHAKGPDTETGPCDCNPYSASLADPPRHYAGQDFRVVTKPSETDLTKQVGEILGTLAGYASVSWDENKTFESTKVAAKVEEATAAVMKLFLDKEAR